MGNWTRIKDINRINLSGRALRFCYIGISYFILEHRNSYHGYSSARYGESPFYLKLSDAKKFIQKNRNRGSSWEIQQAPVIVLVFDKMQISINFSEWDDCNFIISLNKFINSKIKISTNKIIRYLSILRGVYFYKDINNSIEIMSARLVTYKSFVYSGSFRWQVQELDANIPSDYFDLLKLIWPLTKANLKMQRRPVAKGSL
jgi:hypothetical protein